MKVLIALCLIAVIAVSAHPNPNNVHRPGADSIEAFRSWMTKHGKQYASTAEFQTRWSNYRATIQRIENLKKVHTRANFAPNKFSDLSVEEFRATYLTATPPNFGDDNINLADVRVSAQPTEFDWRTKKAVTPVKDQGQCGSCWAFSVTENIESMWFLAGKNMTRLSPQQIVDCDTVDEGCNGGWPYNAYAYVQGAGGLDTEASYPYTSGNTGSGGNCAFNQQTIGAKIKGFTYAIPACQDSCASQDESAMRNVLVAKGPLSVCVNAGSWQDYSSGILDNCDGSYSNLDHCVQLVGYTTTGGYYMVRNSWNTDWGISGYIYLALDPNNNNLNTCGIGDLATYANI